MPNQELLVHESLYDDGQVFAESITADRWVLILPDRERDPTFYEEIKLATIPPLSDYAT